MAQDDTQALIDRMRTEGATDAQILEVLQGGEVTLRPTQPSKPSGPSLSDIADISDKFNGFGEAPFGLGAGGSGSVPATPEMISGEFVEAPGGFGLADGASIAAIPIGAYYAYQGFKDRSTGKAALGGAAAGAGLGFQVGGPVGAGIGAGAGALLGAGSSLFNHKSTKEYIKEGTNSLLDLAPKDAQWNDFVMRSRAAAHGDMYPGVGDQRKPIDNGEVTADSRMFSLGNLETFGTDWMNKYNLEQQRNISQALLDNNLYESSKGDVHVTDQNLARDLAKQVSAGTYQYKAGAPPVAKPPTFSTPDTSNMAKVPPLAVADPNADLASLANGIAQEQQAAQKQQSETSRKNSLLGMANLSSLRPAPVQQFDTSKLLKNRYA